jgi:hypothetical protein
VVETQELRSACIGETHAHNVAALVGERLEVRRYQFSPIRCAQHKAINNCVAQRLDEIKREGRATVRRWMQDAKRGVESARVEG